MLEMGVQLQSGLHTTVLQAEINAAKARIMENMEKDCRGRNICILSDSQTAITALGSFQLNYKLVWEDHQSMVKLAELYRIQLVWVPRRMRIDGNEIAGELAKESASHSLRI